METREGVFETARSAAKCLRDPNILACVTPPAHDLDEFDTASLPPATPVIPGAGHRARRGR